MNRERFLIPEQTPQILLGRFLPEIEKFYNREEVGELTNNNIKPIIARNQEGKVLAKAWHVVIRPRPSADVFPQESIVNFDDVDDTIVRTADTKSLFKDAVAKLVGSDHRPRFAGAVEVINQAARVVPVVGRQTEGIFPLRHAPSLELLAVSDAYEKVESGEATMLPTDTESAHAFIQNSVDLSNYVRIEEGESGKYFVENYEGSLMLDYRAGCPAGVSANIWERFLEIMTKPHIPVEEHGHSDLPAHDLFIPATYGPPEHQMPKIISLAEQWHERGERLPDELLLIVAGPKLPIYNEFLSDPYFPKGIYTPSVWIDDRLPANLEESTIRTGRAHRTRVQQSQLSVNMQQGSLREARDIVWFSTPFFHQPQR